MPVPGPAFEALPRERLLPVALETMHMGHLLDRALMPQVGDRDAAASTRSTRSRSTSGWAPRPSTRGACGG